ncbi:MAG: hypothetical protein PQJ59_02790 [Spirochaetales bacterium]|nr:hypothetical protein [Spirochaetales bacterium]
MTKYGKREDYFYDGTHYISKGAFYKNRSFLIYPTWEEINRNILIPGDRWHPFCPASQAPEDLTLIWENDLIAKKTITYPESALDQYHVLLAKELYNRISSKTTVMDLKSFYRKNDFQVGEALCITVLDYTMGIYRIEAAPKQEYGDNEADLWLSRMESAMGRVISLYGDRLILPLQFDWAYFMGGQKLMSRPAANIRHFLQRTTRFSLTQDEGIYFLTKK